MIRSSSKVIGIGVMHVSISAFLCQSWKFAGSVGETVTALLAHESTAAANSYDSHADERSKIPLSA